VPAGFCQIDVIRTVTKRFEVWKRYLFTPLSELERRAGILWEDGTMLSKGTLPLNVPPQFEETPFPFAYPARPRHQVVNTGIRILFLL
jgi:hypothetical protein